MVLAEDGPLAGALRAAGVEVHVRPLAVVRRELVSVAGLSRLAAAWAADAGGLGFGRLPDETVHHPGQAGAGAMALAGDDLPAGLRVGKAPQRARPVGGVELGEGDGR